MFVNKDWLRNCQLSWYFWGIFPEGRADDYRSVALFSMGAMRRAALFANRESRVTSSIICDLCEDCLVGGKE